jgi:hypothetical protein
MALAKAQRLSLGEETISQVIRVHGKENLTMSCLRWLLVFVLVAVIHTTTANKAYVVPGPCKQCDCRDLYGYFNVPDTGKSTHWEFFTIVNYTKTAASQAYGSLYSDPKLCETGSPYTYYTPTLSIYYGPLSQNACTTDVQPIETSTGGTLLDTSMTDSQYICE